MISLKHKFDYHQQWPKKGGDFKIFNRIFLQRV